MPTPTDLENLIVRLTGNTVGYQQAMMQAQQVTLSTTAAITAKLEDLGAKLKNLGQQAMFRMTLPILGATGLSIKAFSDFDLAMTESQSIMTLVGDQGERMRQQAFDLSSVNKQAPAEIAKAYFFLASAGLDAETSMAAMPTLLTFATAGAFELEKATSLLADSVSALGLKTGNANQIMAQFTRVSDVLVQANILSNASTQEFALALTNDAAASMRMFNMQVEEGVAVLAVYADQGIKGSEAGSMFGRMMRMLTNEARENADVFARYGVRVFDETTGAIKPMADIIEDLTRALGPLSARGRSAALAQMGFKALMQNAILPLLGTAPLMRDYERNLRISGVAGDVAARQMGAFANQMKVLKNQVTIAAIEIGAMLAPGILALNGYIRDAVAWWRGLSPAIRQTVLWIFLAAAAIGPILIALGILTSLMGFGVAAVVKFGSAFLFLGGGLLGLLNPFRLILFVMSPVIMVMKDIGLLTALFIKKAGGFQEAWDVIVDAATRAWEVLKEVGAVISEYIGPALVLIAALAYGAFTEGLNAIEAMWDGLVQFAKDAYAWVQTFIEQNQTLSEVVGGTVMALLGAYAAYRLFWIAVAIATSVLTFFKVQQILSTAAWLAWTAMVWAAWAVVVIFKVSLVFWTAVIAAVTFAIGLMTGATGTWTFAAGVAKVATWLLTAAQTALSLVMTAANILAFASALIFVAGIIAVVVTAVWAAWQAGVALFQVLATIPTTTGPLAAVSAIFDEWLEVIKLVIRAMQVDIKLAWELLAAFGRLAIAQLTDLWPPLWKFIKEGFEILWDVIKDVAPLKFKQALAEMSSELLIFTRDNALMRILFPSVNLLNFADLEGQMARARKAVDDTVTGSVRLGSARLALAGQTFDAGTWRSSFRGGVSGRVMAERVTIADLRARLEAAEAAAERAERGGGGVANGLFGWSREKLRLMALWQQIAPPPTGNELTDNLGKAVQEARKLDAVLRGSAEAMFRIADYVDKVWGPRTAPPAPVVPPPAVPPALEPVGRDVEGGRFGDRMAGGGWLTRMYTIADNISRVRVRELEAVFAHLEATFGVPDMGFAGFNIGEIIRRSIIENATRNLERAREGVFDTRMPAERPGGGWLDRAAAEAARIRAAADIREREVIAEMGRLERARGGVPDGGGFFGEAFRRAAAERLRSLHVEFDAIDAGWWRPPPAPAPAPDVIAAADPRLTTIVEVLTEIRDLNRARVGGGPRLDA